MTCKALVIIVGAASRHSSRNVVEVVVVVVVAAVPLCIRTRYLDMISLCHIFKPAAVPVTVMFLRCVSSGISNHVGFWRGGRL